MGYKIKIAGETELLQLSDIRGEGLYKDFLQKKMPEIVEINGVAFRSTEIRKIWRASIDRKQAEEVPKMDVMRLKEALKKFPQKRINGALVSSRTQYLISKNILRLEGHELCVRAPAALQAEERVFEALERHEYGLREHLKQLEASQ